MPGNYVEFLSEHLINKDDMKYTGKLIVCFSCNMRGTRHTMWDLVKHTCPLNHKESYGFESDYRYEERLHYLGYELDKYGAIQSRIDPTNILPEPYCD